MNDDSLQLNLFDGEGAQGAAADAGAQPGADQAQPDRPDFDQLIKGEYKDQYEKRVKAAIERRFKSQEALVQRHRALEPVLELLAQRYGVSPDDAQALAGAIEGDEALYQQEAQETGMPVDQLRHMKQLERENQSLQRAMTQRQRQAQAERIYADWMEQAQRAKQLYPQLDFAAEVKNGQFLQLLRAGVDVRSAYEVVHRDQIIGGAMQYTAQTVAQKVASDIQARGARPQEIGAGAASASLVRRPRAGELSDQQVRDMARMAKQGIKTRFE